MGYLIVVAVSYLLGSSNMAFYLAKLKKADLRAGGSGNLGASNATVLLGWRAGVAVAVHDIGKAFAAVLLAKLLFPELEYVGAAAGVSCVLGHIFPFYLKFKGGKGLASYLGMTLALNWKLALIVMAVLVAVTVVTDYIVLGTLATIFTVPVSMGFMTRSVIPPMILLIATAVIFIKHWDNYPRILKGTEIGLRSTIRGDHRLEKK